jgi:hypothetical protein
MDIFKLQFIYNYIIKFILQNKMKKFNFNEFEGQVVSVIRAHERNPNNYTGYVKQISRNRFATYEGSKTIKILEISEND